MQIADAKALIFRDAYLDRFKSFVPAGDNPGLWVSLGIVKKYGGSMRFRSVLKPGRSGTTFSVFLPSNPKQ
jgi:hypothetical protein